MADWKPNCEKPQTPLGRFIPNPKLKFMEQCREVMRFNRLALRRRRRICSGSSGLWCSIGSRRARSDGPAVDGWRHPEDMGVAEVRAFLTHLAKERNVSASTQNQALNALLFMYRKVLDRGMEFVEGFERARRQPEVPVVLTKEEMGGCWRRCRRDTGCSASCFMARGCG